MAENEFLRRRLAEARERNRVTRLIENLRSGNVVTSDTIILMEKWGTALETIAAGEKELAPEEMARIALRALAEVS